ncbi:MAG TPA: hypothetical protein VGL39_13955 [Jatrophihabitantaceae bacterium]
MIALAGSRRIGIGVAAAAGALLVLGGCAAGQRAQTADETPVVDGVAANAGSIALRAVTVTAPAASGYAKGSNATLQLVIVNSSLSNDQLIGISTPVAADARMFADEAASTFTPPPTPTDTTSTTPTDTTGSTSTDTTSATPTSTPTDTTGTTPTSTPTDTTSATPTETAAPTLSAIDLPAGRATSIGYTPELPVIQLEGLTRELFPSQAFPITFQFAKAGSVTFTVAVHLAPGPATTPSIDIAPTAEG